MFLILIRLKLVSGHRFHAHSLDWTISGGRREERIRKIDRKIEIEKEGERELCL